MLLFGNTTCGLIVYSLRGWAEALDTPSRAGRENKKTGLGILK
jgi:hypothetical protein